MRCLGVERGSRPTCFHLAPILPSLNSRPDEFELSVPPDRTTLDPLLQILLRNVRQQDDPDNQTAVLIESILGQAAVDTYDREVEESTADAASIFVTPGDTSLRGEGNCEWFFDILTTSVAICANA